MTTQNDPFFEEQISNTMAVDLMTDEHFEHPVDPLKGYDAALQHVSEVLTDKISDKIETLMQIQEQLKKIYSQVLDSQELDMPKYHKLMEDTRIAITNTTINELRNVLDEASLKIDRLVTIRQSLKRPYSSQVPQIDKSFRELLHPIQSIVYSCQNKLARIFTKYRSKFLKDGKFCFFGRTFFVQEEEVPGYIIRDRERVLRFALRAPGLFNLNKEETERLFKIYGCVPGIERVVERHYVFKQKTAAAPEPRTQAQRAAT